MLPVSQFTMNRLRCPATSTNCGHLSAVKKLHELNRVSIDGLVDPVVSIVMAGVKVESNLFKVKTVHRCVVTFEVMNIFTSLKT